ncbi:hypothetical protein MXB_2704, partial [Myxobolus squamalis]
MRNLKDWKFSRKTDLIKNKPERIRKYFKINFLLYEKFSTTMRIKCQSHLIVITLYLNNFKLDCNEFVLDLNIKLPKLKLLLKQL